MKNKIFIVLIFIANTFLLCAQNNNVRELQKENDSLKLVIDSLKNIFSESEIKDPFSFRVDGREFTFMLSDTLLLQHRDSEYGEWGGNTHTIKIYRKNRYLYALFIFEEWKSDDMEQALTARTITTRESELTYDDEDLVLKCVFELMEAKMKNITLWKSDKGRLILSSLNTTINRLILKSPFRETPSLHIEALMDYPDYPSSTTFSWDSFHQLKSKLLLNN